MTYTYDVELIVGLFWGVVGPEPAKRLRGSEEVALRDEEIGRLRHGDEGHHEEYGVGGRNPDESQVAQVWAEAVFHHIAQVCEYLHQAPQGAPHLWLKSKDELFTCMDS